VILALASPAWAATTRGMTYKEQTLGRRQTLCDDGTRAVSTDNRTLSRWESTISPPPGTPPRICTPATTGRGVEVRCR
jgi:hypothetical protein